MYEIGLYRQNTTILILNVKYLKLQLEREPVLFDGNLPCGQVPGGRVFGVIDNRNQYW